MNWMEVAWAELGVDEVPGTRAEPTIIEYFRDAGRPEITSDEISWCAAFVGACLHRANINVDGAIPRAKKLLARSYLDFGTPIDKPRVGAIAVFWRGKPDSWQGHVNFVVGETKTHIIGLGGNQANSVSVQHYPKYRLLGLRWPEPTKTPAEIEAEGSRTAKAAREQRKDAAKTIASGGSGKAVETAEPKLPDITDAAQEAGAFQNAIATLSDFLNFALDKWPYIAIALAVYFGARIVWNGGRIRKFRAEDQNVGKHVGAAS